MFNTICNSTILLQCTDNKVPSNNPLYFPRQFRPVATFPNFVYKTDNFATSIREYGVQMRQLQPTFKMFKTFTLRFDTYIHTRGTHVVENCCLAMIQSLFSKSRGFSRGGTRSRAVQSGKT